MSIMRTLTINGEKFNVTPVVPAASVTLLASAWVGNGESYSQVVQVSGVTSHTKVDLQPTPEQLAEFHYLTLAFVAENDGGVVTVYAIGDKPSGDHTIQTTLTEVEREGKIRGNTVGTTMPRTDFNQTDPTQADYLHGREKIVQSVNGVAPDENGNVTVPTGGGGAVSDEQIAQAVEDYMAENPVVPDSSQNVTLTTAQINALDNMFKVCAFIKEDVSAEYAAFQTAFGISGGEEEPDEPVNPEVTLTSISAVYDGGDVVVGTAVTDLTGIVVTAHYSDGTSETVTGYTLSGTIAEGSNTITVSYGGKTTTFTVTGVAESTGEVVDTTAVIAAENVGIDTNGATVDNCYGTALTGICVTKVYEYTYDNDALKASDQYDSTNDYMSGAGAQGGFKVMTPSAKHQEAGGISTSLVQVTKTRTTADGEYVSYMSNNSYSGTLSEQKVPNKHTKLVNAQKVGFEFVVFKADIDDSYAYWHKPVTYSILPIGVRAGDIIFAGKNTPYYGMSNIDEHTGA